MNKAVILPTIKIRDSAVLDNSTIGDTRVTRKIPAVTMVAA